MGEHVMRAATPTAEGIVECEGARIAYEIYGAADGPTLLLAQTWEIIHLGRLRRVLLHRGLLRSPLDQTVGRHRSMGHGNRRRTDRPDGDVAASVAESNRGRDHQGPLSPSSAGPARH